MKPYVTKKYLSLLVQSSMQRVLEVLFTYPEKEFSLSDLAKESAVAKSHIGPILMELARLQLVTITKLTKIWRIRANQQHWNFLKAKIVYNLNFVYQSGIVEALSSHFKNPRAIILFGSFRKGEDLSTSDIDIAIESDEAQEYQTLHVRELEAFEEIIKRRIQIHVFSRKFVDANVFGSIANGIVIFGFLEASP